MCTSMFNPPPSPLALKASPPPGFTLPLPPSPISIKTGAFPVEVKAEEGSSEIRICRVPRVTARLILLGAVERERCPSTQLAPACRLRLPADGLEPIHHLSDSDPTDPNAPVGTQRVSVHSTERVSRMKWVSSADCVTSSDCVSINSTECITVRNVPVGRNASVIRRSILIP